jgi:acetyl/propionyl-CoA carboxylase alpha subunit
MHQRFWVKGSGEGQFFDYEETGRNKWVRMGDTEFLVDLSTKPGSSFLHVLINGRSYPCTFREEGNILILDVRGKEYRFEVLSERRKRIRDLGISEDQGIGNKDIIAPIPGLIVEIEVAVGEKVEVGQGIVIMEAMKMENELKAPGEGIVKEIRVGKGTPVDQGQLLVVVE